MNSDYKVGEIVWEPSTKRVEGSEMSEYLAYLNKNHSVEASWDALINGLSSKKNCFGKAWQLLQMYGGMPLTP